MIGVLVLVGLMPAGGVWLLVIGWFVVLGRLVRLACGFSFEEQQFGSVESHPCGVLDDHFTSAGWPLERSSTGRGWLDTARSLGTLCRRRGRVDHPDGGLLGPKAIGHASLQHLLQGVCKK